MACKRCGQCCKDRGSFWHLSDHPLIKKFNDRRRQGRSIKLNMINEAGECLLYDGFDCLIEKYLGWEAKPEICKQYNCEKCVTATITIKEAKKRAVHDALVETHGNRTTAARILGIPERTLYRYIAADPEIKNKFKVRE